MRRAAVLLGAFLLLGARAKAEWMPPNASNMGIVMFTVQNGAAPTLGTMYPLNGTVPLQKLPNGYFIVSMFGDGTPAQPVFLKTKSNFSQGRELGGWAKCIGYTEYEGINGFPQKAFAFEEVRHR